MRVARYTITAVFSLILLQLSVASFGQLGISFNLKKPKEYDERVLPYEKSETKKFTLPRRFIQNTTTHYNYYFNANNKLNEVLERAKLAFVDDYSQLLPFYNYSLDVTAADSIQLDSVTYKSSTGIALHDLRNDWADNLYLLWGAAYYLRKDFDSAYMMFQFINYAFAPKEKDGYYRTIGSARDGNSAFSISTQEKNSLTRRIFTEPPSRNDAFIWQIRNFLAQDQMPEAASMIVMLRNDPGFPKRLHNDLHEVQAYWFYKQNMWDSSAAHLSQALSNATNKQEKARWEFLLAQLYEMSGDYKNAEKYFGKVSGHTTDPIMDIYARLYAVRTNKDGGEKSVQKNVEQLLKMAKRDKYEEYQDIIYYMAAQMLIDAKDIDGALALLQKSTKYVSNNPAQRNRAFLQLAELSFARQQYKQSYNFYDSIKLDDPSLKNADAIAARKKSLGLLVTNLYVIERQDSLLRIAGLPEDERREYVRKMVRQIRKQQGLKDEKDPNSNSPFTTTQPPLLFPTNEPRGEWYFYNSSYRSRGINDFKTKWGNRPNVDNWRRIAAVSGTITGGNQQGQGDQQNRGQGDQQQGDGINFDALYGNLPLTDEQVKKANDSIQVAMLGAGKAYIQEIEDCAAGTRMLEDLRNRYPGFTPMEEVLFNLYYCYTKNGETGKAAAIKKLMSEKYPGSNFTTIVTTGKNPQASNNPEATKTYEHIYDLFIEGKFTEAVAQKKDADARYGTNYWTPQLLYIEAVYYIKQREDSVAKNVLNSIVSQFPNTPLAAKASNLIDVLGRRKQIEDELSRMTVIRPADDSVGKTQPPVTIITAPPKPKDTTTVKTPPPVTVINPPKTDTVKTKPPVVSAYTFKPDVPHYVVLVLNKVDPVFSNEAKNAFFRYNRETFYNKTYSIDLFQLDPDNRLLMIAPFPTAKEAIDYIDKTKPRTATEIIPWLKGGKYSFSIMTDANFDVLKTLKDVEKYREFLNQHFPGKF